MVCIVPHGSLHIGEDPLSLGPGEHAGPRLVAR